MADVISDRDRKLIDDAIAEGRVTHVPYGVRKLTAAEFTYSHLSGRLVYTDKQQMKARLRAGNQWGAGVYRTLQGKDND